MTSKKHFTVKIGDLIIEKNPNGDITYGIITNIDIYLDIEIFWFDIRDFFYYNIDDIKSFAIDSNPRKWEIIRSKK